MQTAILNTLPSPLDSRDYRYRASKSKLREDVDLRLWASEVDDQSTLGSCVGNAIVNAYELLVRRLYPTQFVDLSRLFVYYNGRALDNNINTDTGLYIRNGIKSAANYGLCSEKIWPYNIDNLTVQPSPEAYVDAAQRVITRYETLYTTDEVLEVLSNNRPVVIGMETFADFMDMTAADPVIKLPAYRAYSVGAHAVTLVGYNLTSQQFLVKNSFGTSWGDRGYFYMPFDYMIYVFERWCFDISSQPPI